jgi:nucleotide-binding universal stress UspA family protein
LVPTRRGGSTHPPGAVRLLNELVITTERVIVGIDGAPSGGQALSWAASEADRKGVELLIVHVSDVVRPAAVSSAAVVTVIMEGGDYGRELLSDAAAVVAGSHPSVKVSTVLRAGNPAEVLLELGTVHTLLVIGTNGEGRFLGALVGSVSHRVAAHAGCPVVVIPHDRAVLSAHRQIVVGVITPLAGHETLRFGFQEAAERRSDLVAVCAYGTFSRTARDPILRQLSEVREQEQQELLDTVAHLQDEFPTVQVEARLVDEPVVGALCLAATDADLLIVGCRYDDAHRSSRLGAVAARILHTSPCPVAVIGLAHTVAVAAS